MLAGKYTPRWITGQSTACPQAGRLQAERRPALQIAISLEPDAAQSADCQEVYGSETPQCCQKVLPASGNSIAAMVFAIRMPASRAGLCSPCDWARLGHFPNYSPEFFRNIFASQAFSGIIGTIGANRPRLHGFHRFLPHLWELFLLANRPLRGRFSSPRQLTSLCGGLRPRSHPCNVSCAAPRNRRRRRLHSCLLGKAILFCILTNSQ